MRKTLTAISTASALALAACSADGGSGGNSATATDGQAAGRPAVSADLAQYQEAERLAQEHLAKFDTLDYDVFSNQQWDRLSESHAGDIKVHWPDGHVETGLDTHINSLKALFTFAPDTRIKQHPVKIGKGEWTAVYGIMEGTFTKPMTMPNGKVVQPTGKAFKLPMATIGHWVNGTMDAEYLFWDNKTYYSQLGVPAG